MTESRVFALSLRIVILSKALSLSLDHPNLNIADTVPPCRHEVQDEVVGGRLSKSIGCGLGHHPVTAHPLSTRSIGVPCSAANVTCRRLCSFMHPLEMWSLKARLFDSLAAGCHWLLSALNGGFNKEAAVLLRCQMHASGIWGSAACV